MRLGEGKHRYVIVTDAASIGAIKIGNASGDLRFPAGAEFEGVWFADAQEWRRWRQRQAETVSESRNG